MILILVYLPFSLSIILRLVYRTCSSTICLTPVSIQKMCFCDVYISKKVFITLLSMLSAMVIIFVIIISLFGCVKS